MVEIQKDGEKARINKDWNSRVTGKPLKLKNPKKSFKTCP